MFGFLESDALGSDQNARRIKAVKMGRDSALVPMSDTVASVAAASCKKRGRQSLDSRGAAVDGSSPAKRQRQHDQGPASDPASSHDASPTPSFDPARLGQARDIISHEFGLEILLKHNELRLINQELAKCQTALEQLRRCHLIPYPHFCPTPDQMLDITDGKGYALLPPSGAAVPPWAPPFGVVDGPYSRHFARWLLPDPSFDGEQPENPPAGTLRRARNAMVEGRVTRKSFNNPLVPGRARSARSHANPHRRLHALPTSYHQPKGKAGPCIVRRPDGTTVKLVCLDCHRDNFSSTQGFINHCRIAHRRDFKTHEEAAAQSGQPVEDANATTTTTLSAQLAAGRIESTTATSATASAAASVAATTLKAAASALASASASALVHPLARVETTEQQAIAALRARIDASLQMYCAGQPHVAQRLLVTCDALEASSSASARAARFLKSPDAPHLSRFMEGRRFHGSLPEIVADATKKTCLDEVASDVEAEETDVATDTAGSDEHPASRPSPPVPMRVPARAARRPVQTSVRTRSSSDKQDAAGAELVSPAHDPAQVDGMAAEEEVYGTYAAKSGIVLDDADLSPNTATSNNAPSLISDDGEYDESDASSVSGASESAEEPPISVDTEITTDYEHDSPTVRRDSGSGPSTMKLRKDDAKHVTFLGSLPTRTRGRPRRILRSRRM